MLKNFTLWKKSIDTAGFEPANLGSSGEYDNHGTTGVDDGQIAFGDLVGLKIPDSCLIGEEKPRK